MLEAIANKVTEAQNTFKKLVDDQVGRVESGYEEVAKIEKKNAEQTRDAMDEMARLSKDTMTYALAMSAEWRKLSLEATKASMAIFLGTSKKA